MNGSVPSQRSSKPASFLINMATPAIIEIIAAKHKFIIFEFLKGLAYIADKSY